MTLDETTVLTLDQVCDGMTPDAIDPVSLDRICDGLAVNFDSISVAAGVATGFFLTIPLPERSYMASVGISINASVGGVSICGNISESANGQAGDTWQPVAGQDSTLTTRSGNTAGVVTTASALVGIQTGDTVDVFWDAGVQYGCTATVSGNAVTIASGAGTNLPTQSYVTVLSKPTTGVLQFVGNKAHLVMVSSDKKVSVTFRTAAHAVIFQVTIPAGQTWMWSLSSGLTNPFAGQTVAEVLVSCGDISGAATVNIGVLFDNV